MDTEQKKRTENFLNNLKLLTKSGALIVFKLVNKLRFLTQQPNF